MTKPLVTTGFDRVAIPAVVVLVRTGLVTTGFGSGRSGLSPRRADTSKLPGTPPMTKPACNHRLHRCHTGGGGFTVRTGHGNNPTVAQDEIMQPLWARHERNIAFQYRLNARITSRHGVANDHQIRRGIQLAGIITLNQRDALFFRSVLIGGYTLASEPVTSWPSERASIASPPMKVPQIPNI